MEFISYAEALSLASRGILTEAVLRSMRNEISRAEKEGPSKSMHLFDARINLGVALMQLGNQSPNPSKLYDESENLFLSILKLHPEYEPAIRNIGIVRKNRRIRAGVAIDDDSRNEERHQALLIPTRTRRNKTAGARLSLSSTMQDEKQAACTNAKKSKRRFLTIGIPTVPRANDQHYLTQTLNAIIEQLPTRSDNPFYDSVVVVVQNNRPGKHTEFDELKSQIEQSDFSNYFQFKEAVVDDEDAFPIDPSRQMFWRREQSKVRFVLNFCS